jgi:hypothetical protein
VILVQMEAKQFALDPNLKMRRTLGAEKKDRSAK